MSKTKTLGFYYVFTSYANCGEFFEVLLQTKENRRRITSSAAFSVAVDVLSIGWIAEKVRQLIAVGIKNKVH